MKQTYNVGYLQTPSVKHLANVKQALADTGLASPTTPNEMLPDAIKENMQAFKDQIPVTWETIDVGSLVKEHIPPYDNLYYLKNGYECIGSYSSSSKQGIFLFNLLTGEEKKIYQLSYNWQYFFETSSGNVLIATNVRDTGLVCYNIGDTNAINIYGWGHDWKYFFEASDKTVYICSDSIIVSGSWTPSGVLKFENDNIIEVYKDISGGVFCELDDGSIYIGTAQSTATIPNNYGILYIKGDTVKKVLTDGAKWKFVYNKNHVYASTDASNHLGIYHIKDGVANKLLDTGYYYKYYSFGDDIYVSCHYSYQYGLFHLKDGVITTIFENGYNYTFNRNSLGELYISSGTNGPVGLYFLKGTNVTLVYDQGFAWAGSYESAKKDFYIYKNSGNGLLYVKGTTAVLLSSIERLNEFYETKKGDLYVTSVSKEGLLHISGSNTTNIFTTGRGWKNYFELEDGRVITSTMYSSTIKNQQGILLLNGASATQVYNIDYDWKYYTEQKDYVVIAKEPTPSANDFVLFNKNTNKTFLVRGVK